MRTCLKVALPLLLLALILTLTACNGNLPSEDTTAADAATTAADVTEAPTEQPTEAPTGEDTEAPTEENTTETPTEAPTEPEETEPAPEVKAPVTLIPRTLTAADGKVTVPSP